MGAHLYDIVVYQAGDGGVCGCSPLWHCCLSGWRWGSVWVLTSMTLLSIRLEMGEGVGAHLYDIVVYQAGDGGVCGCSPLWHCCLSGWRWGSVWLLTSMTLLSIRLEMGECVAAHLYDTVVYQAGDGGVCGCSPLWHCCLSGWRWGSLWLLTSVTLLSIRLEMGECVGAHLYDTVVYQAGDGGVRGCSPLWHCCLSGWRWGSVWLLTSMTLLSIRLEMGECVGAHLYDIVVYQAGDGGVCGCSPLWHCCLSGWRWGSVWVLTSMTLLSIRLEMGECVAAHLYDTVVYQAGDGGVCGCSPLWHCCLSGWRWGSVWVLTSMTLLSIRLEMGECVAAHLYDIVVYQAGDGGVCGCSPLWHCCLSGWRWGSVWVLTSMTLLSIRLEMGECVGAHLYDTVVYQAGDGGVCGCSPLWHCCLSGWRWGSVWVLTSMTLLSIRLEMGECVGAHLYDIVVYQAGDGGVCGCSPLWHCCLSGWRWGNAWPVSSPDHWLLVTQICRIAHVPPARRYYKQQQQHHYQQKWK